MGVSRPRSTLVREDLNAQKSESYKTLVDALNQSLRSVFGKSATTAIYYYLEKKYQLKMEDILEKPLTFTKAIEEIFGKTGAEIVETLLTEELASKFGTKSKKIDTDNLVKCFNELKNIQLEK